MAIYVTNGEGQRFKVTGSGGGGIDEVPIATETTVGGIISSPDASNLFVDPNTGIASVNDNVSMNGAGMIILSGLGDEDGVHTIEFTNDPEPADVVAFDNTSTGMTATNVQSAIDEFYDEYQNEIQPLQYKSQTHSTQITNLQSEVTNLNTRVEDIGLNITYIQNLLRYYSKENLLDNWYLKSPVNQFNKGSYTNNGENLSAFDRWVTSGGATVTYITNSHIHVSFPNNDYSTLGQFIPFPFRYAGQKITISAYCKQTTGTTSLVITNNINQLLNVHLPTEWTCVSYTITMPDTNDFFWIGFQNQTQPSEFEVMFMKVEVNNQQTLMHHENGVWVLNDTPPNESEMLTRCARYLQVFGTRYTHSEIGSYDLKAFDSNNNVSIEWQIPLITKMSGMPNIYINGGFRVAYEHSSHSYYVDFTKDEILFYASYREGFTNVFNFNLLLNGTLDRVRNIGAHGFIDSGNSTENFIALASPVE